MDSPLPQVSVVCGARTVVPAAPLPKHFAHQASSDNTALVYADETCNVRVSYAELEARSNSLARAITSRARASGTNRDGDYVIALCMQPTHSTIITLLATWKAGAAYLPMETYFPQAKISHILKDAQPALIIYDETANPVLFSPSGIPAVSYEELAHEASGLSADAIQDMETLAPIKSESIAIVLYTSGSTGIPKGVRLSHSAICNRLWWQFHTFPYADSEVNCVWKTALTFLDSVGEICGPLLHGRTLLILSRETTRDPQKLVKVLDDNLIERLVLVPSLLRSILMYLSLKPFNRPLQKLKLWVCSGETLSKNLAAQFFKYFGDHNGYKLGNFYGSTELMADVTYYVLENTNQLDIHPTIPIGTPIDNCEIYLLDEEMNPTRVSEPGEVWVAGSNLAAGYVGRQGADKFVNNPGFGRLYRTGDFGVLQKGVILYAGRADSQIKIRGYRVDLQEVDRAVAGVDGVDKCVVLSYVMDSGNPEILSFVTIKPGAEIAARDIEAALKNSLIDYMIPQVIEVESIPLQDDNGKVDRQALLRMYENTNNNDIDYSSVSPSDMQAATVLFETVSEVLGRSARGSICAEAGFYELGGNSLNSIYTITRLRDKGYYIDISQFLSAANLGEVLSNMSTIPNPDGDFSELAAVEPLADEHKQQVIQMIVSSFCIKAELKQSCLKNEAGTNEYEVFMNDTWPAIMNAKLSFVLKNLSGAPVAVALNFDARDEPKVKTVATGEVTKIMIFLDFVESSVRDSMLPPGKGTILHSFMMATARSLTPRENVAAIRSLEYATIKLAKDKGFRGVFTTNTNPLTQQLGTVLGFQTLLDYQMNQYIDPNGDRIFEKAPDKLRAIVCWKPLD